MKSKIERVDDIPLLVSAFEKSDLSTLLSKHFPDHGNWQGISIGKVTIGFLTYILSCSDHRISHVEPWAAERLITLGHCLGEQTLTAKDFTDDKLTSLLERYSDDDAWSSFEHAHNQRLINVYQLNESPNNAIRLDAMITQSHRVADGEFQYGHAKQHRADLPQLKTMVATLDPMAMPLYSLTVAGNTADDVLYLPILKELIPNLNLEHQLFVGDSKMGSMEIRSYLQHEKQYYLVPLSKKQCSEEELMAYLAHQPKTLVEVYSEDDIEQKCLKAKAFEQLVAVTNKQNGNKWDERRIVVYSPAFAQRQTKIFENRLFRVLQELSLILAPRQGRKKLQTYEDVNNAVQQLLAKYSLKNIIAVKIEKIITSKTIRAYGNRPQRVENQISFKLQTTVNEILKAQYLKRLGWRVYACNAPQKQLNTEQVVSCYRNEYRIEHKFDELINRVTALMPVLLHKPHRIKALIRLLLLALKYVSLIQYRVRTELKTTKQKIKELYPSNPGRATDKPSTTMILRAFRNIHLNIVAIEDKIYVNIPNLKSVQLQILQFLDISPNIYDDLAQLSFSQFNFSET